MKQNRVYISGAYFLQGAAVCGPGLAAERPEFVNSISSSSSLEH